MTECKKAPLWWKSECPKYGEPCNCKEECMYLRQKSLRKLDVIVAEKVMGHKIIPNNGKDRPEEWAKEKYFIEVDFGISLIPHYSTDIAAAFEVATHLQKKGYYVCIEMKACEVTSVGVYEENPVEQIAYAKAQTPAEAICKAALLAVTGEGTLEIEENLFRRTCKCGWIVEIRDFPDESTVYGNDCPNGRCEM